MKYALFIIKTNENDNADKAALSLKIYLQKIQDRADTMKGLSLLNPGAILIDLSLGLKNLTFLSYVAEELKVQSRTLFFDQEPSWVITP